MIDARSPTVGLRRRLLFAALALLAIFVPYYVATIAYGPPIPRDGTGLAVGRDFLNFWLYGRAAFAADPARYYDLPTYWAAIEQVAGPDYPGQQWSYPPSLMLVAAPFGLMPYLPALAVWSLLGVGAFIAAVRLWTRDRLIIAACVLAPAGLFGFISGQLAYLGAAAMLAVLRWRETRPMAAGVILGAMTIKPQLALLLPVMLIATRNWRAIAAAGLTASALVGATAALWGVAVWRAWLQHGIASQAGVLSDGSLIVAPFMPTAFMNLRVAGLAMPAAQQAQVLLTLAAVAAVAAAFRRRPASGDMRANALLLSASVAATPYLMAYDLLALSTAAVLCARQRQDGGRLTLLIYLLPLINMALVDRAVPGAAALPIAYGAWLWSRRAARHGHPVTQAPSAG